MVTQLLMRSSGHTMNFRLNHGQGKESVKLCGDLPYKVKSKHLNPARERNTN